ncbi:MAG TPA: hypothetical protein VLA67_11345 [Nitrospiraceae bacterium]|nr:hypothetical protein [Nitrospiraceae bacterium]
MELLLYNGLVLNAIDTEGIVIGTLAGLGVIVLLVMVVYVVRLILKKES